MIFRNALNAIWNQPSSDGKPANEPAPVSARLRKRQEELRDGLQCKVDLYNRSEGHLDEADGIDCPMCRNKGLIEEVRNDRRFYSIMVECECMKLRRSWKALQKRQPVGIRQKLSLDSFAVSEDWQVRIRQRAERYVQDSSGWLYIGGAPGCGKTHICSAICREFLRQNLRVRYMDWPKEVILFKAKVLEDEHDSRIQELTEWDVLYIDDFLGAEGETDPDGEPVDEDVKVAREVIEACSRSGKRVVISSGWLLDELRGLDKDMGDRICERGRGYTLQVAREKGRDYRALSEEQEEELC